MFRIVSQSGSGSLVFRHGWSGASLLEMDGTSGIVRSDGKKQVMHSNACGNTDFLHNAQVRVGGGQLNVSGDGAQRVLVDSQGGMSSVEIVGKSGSFVQMGHGVSSYVLGMFGHGEKPIGRDLVLLGGVSGVLMRDG